MKLVLLTLVVSASALTKPQVRQFKEVEVSASSTRASKPFCMKADQLEEGLWVSLREGEYSAAPEGSNCNPMKMMWEPNTCKLPYHSSEAEKRPGRVVFIGDSIAETQARSFAWFYDKLWAKDLNACKYEKTDVKDKLRPQLEKAGFNPTAITKTIEYMEAQGFRKNHHWWGCNSTVQYVPTDTPPPQDAVKPFMYALKNFGAKPLGPKDVIVLNWGMWDKTNEADAAWKSSMKVLMKEYSKWQNAKIAPKLIWREISPTHWGGGLSYTRALFEKTQTTTKACTPVGPKQVEAQMKHKNEFPLKNTNMFKDAVKEAGLEIDGVNIEFLPVWRPSSQRYEDHQPLTKYQKSEHQIIDCTHWCTHGNTMRFWNSALVSVMDGMIKEV